MYDVYYCGVAAAEGARQTELQLVPAAAGRTRSGDKTTKIKRTERVHCIKYTQSATDIDPAVKRQLYETYALVTFILLLVYSTMKT